MWPASEYRACRQTSIASGSTVTWSLSNIRARCLFNGELDQRAVLLRESRCIDAVPISQAGHSGVRGCFAQRRAGGPSPEHRRWECLDISLPRPRSCSFSVFSPREPAAFHRFAESPLGESALCRRVLRGTHSKSPKENR
jgi:hypothetical protein